MRSLQMIMVLLSSKKLLRTHHNLYKLMMKCAVKIFHNFLLKLDMHKELPLRNLCGQPVTMMFLCIRIWKAKIDLSRGEYMWPIPSLHHKLVTILFSSDAVTCCWIEKSTTSAAPLIMRAYQRYPLDNLESIQLMLF